MDATADKDVDMSSAEAEQNTDENDESGIEDVSDEDDDGEDDEDDGEEEEDEDESEEEDNEEGDAVEDDEEWDTENDDDDEDDDEDEMLEVSDSDGETGDRCPICLNRFREQDLGTPEACDHAFCLECILEWSKNVNTCPVDRQQFRLIFCRHSGENNVYKRIIVQDRNRQAEEEEDLTYCEVCDQCDREDRLLLCDGCDKGYHLECLTPPLQEVPVNEWFCPECAQRQVEEDETVHSRSQRRRQVARTRVMERVRSAIEELRVRRIRNLRQILSSSEDEQEEAATGDNTAATATSTPASSAAKKPAAKKPRRKTPRKYKKRKTKTKTKRKRKSTTKKRKTTKRKTTGRKRKGRKGKKKRARTVKQSVPVTTVKSRIAGALGLETPPAGRTIPTQRSKLDKPIDSGSASLSIFGNKEELIHFEDDYGADAPAGRSKYSRSALSSYKPIGRVPVIIPEKKKKIVIKTTPVSTSNSLDILGSIMQDQSKLHMDSKNVKIERDGSLVSSGKQAVEAKAQSSKFFKSSFTAVSGSWGPSILNSLSSAGKSSDPNTDVAAEEYDPAFPTEEIEEDIEVKKDNKEDDKYDPAHPTDELDDVSEEEEEVKEEIVQSAKSSHKTVPNKVITIGEFLASESGKKKESKKNKEVKKNAKQDSKKSKVSASGGHSELKNKVKESEDKCETFEIEEDIPLCKDVIVSPTKDKKQESAKKLSPSVKITETGKKVSPTAIKPFEISKKILFEKKRLYGGEIDFTEDVNFSDAGFENFEVNIKAIESVFKGTAKKPDADSKEDKKESEKDRDGVKSSLNDAVNEKVTLQMEKSETTVDLKETETLTVSERFRMLSDDTRDQDIVSLEEEDPIHEMRKLDKELDLELENPDVGKEWHKSKSEIDREHKKSRRKVSIDKEDEVRVRHKKEGKDKKRDWEEVEEGEVEDEHQYRERKRREKRERKKKAAEKERYYNDIDMQFGDLDNPDSEIDTRIVVQVSQNTDSRTVWEEDEKIRKKKDKEEKERRKNKHRDEERSSKKERKRKRRRSRSHSYDSRDKSKSRDRKRSRSRSRERSKRRHRDRSRSRSLERSRKKKKKARDRSRDKHRSRDKSEERVDIFGRSRSPFRRKETSKNKSLSPAYQTKYSAMKNKKSDIEVSLSKKAKLDGEVILIDDDDDEEEEEVDKLQDKSDPRNTHSDDNSVPSTPKEDPEDAQKEEPPSQIEVKESSQRDISSDERDEDYDDEPEETEQFNYTDRDEYLSQNKHKQQHQNLIQVGVDGGSYDPANPTESSSPIAPPLPDGGRVHTPTPPLPPVGEFNPMFPPPPPGPPPPGPPPPTVLIQDRPPVPPQLNGPPGQGIMGDAPPILIRGPPPMEPGPAPGIIHQRPNISVPVNINVVPPGFHRGLPQTIQPQRQIIVNAFRPGMQRMQRLPNPSVPRFGFTTTAEAVTPQFGMPSHPRPGIINGPYEGLPPPSEGQPQNLPPPHSHFPLGGELQPPPQHILPMQADGPPPSNLVHIPVEVEEGTVGLPIRPLGPPISSTPDTEPHLIHIGPMSNEPRPRLPIPLLPTSEVPSAMVSIPPPAMSLPPPVMSVPSPGSIPSVPSIPPHMPPHVSPHLMSEEDPYIDSQTPPHNLVKSPEMSTHMNNNTTVIPGLDMVEPTEGETHSSIGKSKKSFSQLEEISKLLNTQAKLMLDTKSKNSSDTKKNGPVSKDDGVFKVPFPPGTKSSGNKNEVVETTEVVDMDMASPILEEGNIELPVSPQFDNLIDTDDWLEEVYDNKTKKNEEESEKVEKWEEDEDEDEGEQNNTISELTDKWMEIINNIPKKPIETNDKLSAVLNKPEPKEVKSSKEKVSPPVKVKEKDQETKKDSPKKSVEAKKQSSKENKVKSRQHRKHKHRPEPAKEINLKLKAQVDTELDLDSQELTSAVDMTNKEKYLRKLHLQERVVEEVKMAIKPHYANKKIDKEQYKEIMRKAVPKICHSKSGDINPMKIKSLIEAYVDRFNKPKHSKNSDKQEVSPAGVKANGERAKVKTAR